LQYSKPEIIREIPGLIWNMLYTKMPKLAICIDLNDVEKINSFQEKDFTIFALVMVPDLFS
jgi:ABC-type polysaccharide transport system permease subunit